MVKKSYIEDARAALSESAKNLQGLKDTLTSNAEQGIVTDEATLKAVADAEKAFKAAKTNHAAVRGELGGGIKQMVNNVLDLARKKPKEEAETVLQEAQRLINKPGKAGWTERLVSKPFRVLANNPKAAAAAGVLGVVAVGSSLLKGHAARRSEQNVQNQIAEMQQMQAMAASHQAPVSYMNSASQADVEARMAADRANGAAPASQSAALAARQSAPEAATAPAI